ncbi:MAG: hypothetical protein ABIJ30_00425 [bacterium]
MSNCKREEPLTRVHLLRFTPFVALPFVNEIDTIYCVSLMSVDLRVIAVFAA